MKLIRKVEDKLLLKLQLNPTAKIQHFRPIVFSDREPSGETSDWHLFLSGMPMEEDALMDGRTDADADVTEKPSRGMPNIFFCLSARLRVAGLEKKPLSPTLLSAVQSSGVIFKRRLKSIMRRGSWMKRRRTDGTLYGLIVNQYQMPVVRRDERHNIPRMSHMHWPLICM